MDPLRKKRKSDFEESLKKKKLKLYENMGYISRKGNRQASFFIFSKNDQKDKQLQSNKNPLTNVPKMQRLLVDKQKKRIKNLDTIIALVNFVAIFIASYDYSFYIQNLKHSLIINHILRTIVLLITISSNILLYYKYSSVLNKEKSKGKFNKELKLHQSNIFKQLILECTINMLMPYPGLDYQFEYEQLSYISNLSVPEILYSFVVFRAYHLLRLFQHYSGYSGNKADTLCEMHKCKADTIFTIKCVLKQKPFTFSLISLLCVTIIFGVLIRIYEINVQGKFIFLWNSFWFTIVSITSVGYGDIVPKTQIGRLLTVIIVIFGTFLTSMLTVALSQYVEFEPKEKLAFQLIELNEQKDIQINEAAKYIQICYRLYKLQKTNNNNSINTNQQQKQRSQNRLKKISELQWSLVLQKRKFQKTFSNQLSNDETTADQIQKLTEEANAELHIVKSRLCKFEIRHLKTMCHLNDKMKETLTKTMMLRKMTQNNLEWIKTLNVKLTHTKNNNTISN